MALARKGTQQSILFQRAIFKVHEY